MPNDDLQRLSELHSRAVLIHARIVKDEEEFKAVSREARELAKKLVASTQTPIRSETIPTVTAIPDWVTCCSCQADMAEAIGEQNNDDEWPDWLNAGCCSPECFTLSANA